MRRQGLHAPIRTLDAESLLPRWTKWVAGRGRLIGTFEGN
jgi:hypothetical protein